MSLTKTVPPDEPSDFQSSRPFTVSVAEKKSVEPTAVRLMTVLELIPGLISKTNDVPANVPLDFHNSRPLVPSVAEKKSVEPTAVNFWGTLLLAPGFMSLTISVRVPSDFHNS